MANDGKQLTDDEVREYLAYGNAGIAAPDKFAGVVVDATDPRGIVYRRQTAAEAKAATEAASAAEAAAADNDKLVARVRGEAEKRGAAVPEMPAPPELPKA